MMVNRASLVLALVLALGAGLAAAAPADEPVTVMAFVGSASMPVLEEAAALLERDLDVRLVLNFGGSGSLLSQLELSRRGDLYMPGSHDYLERAVSRQVVDPSTRVDFAYLVPALLVREGNPLQVAGLADLTRRDVRGAIAEPRTVCVGLYAGEILERAGLAGPLLPRLGRARSCAGVANLLALGSVDAILGWRVFEAWFPDRLQVVEIPAGLITRVATVPGAVTTFARRPEAARRVLEWLAGAGGREIWRRHGYIVDPDRARALAPGAAVASGDPAG